MVDEATGGEFTGGVVAGGGMEGVFGGDGGNSGVFVGGGGTDGVFVGGGTEGEVVGDGIYGDGFTGGDQITGGGKVPICPGMLSLSWLFWRITTTTTAMRPAIRIRVMMPTSTPLLLGLAFLCPPSSSQSPFRPSMSR